MKTNENIIKKCKKKKRNERENESESSKGIKVVRVFPLGLS